MLQIGHSNGTKYSINGTIGSDGPICRQSRNQIMAAYLLSKLLEIQLNILPRYCEKMGSTNFTMVPTRTVSNWSPASLLDFSRDKGVGRWTDAGIPLGPPKEDQTQSRVESNLPARRQTHGSQSLRNLRSGSGGTAGKMLHCSTLFCGSSECLSLYNLP